MHCDVLSSIIFIIAVGTFGRFYMGFFEFGLFFPLRSVLVTYDISVIAFIIAFV